MGAVTPTPNGLHAFATSAPVITPTTPSIASAALTSHPRRRAWAWGERTMAAWYGWATGGWSSMNVPRPVRSRPSSTRGTDRPIQERSAIGLEVELVARVDREHLRRLGAQ